MLRFRYPSLEFFSRENVADNESPFHLVETTFGNKISLPFHFYPPNLTSGRISRAAEQEEEEEEEDSIPSGSVFHKCFRTPRGAVRGRGERGLPRVAGSERRG